MTSHSRPRSEAGSRARSPVHGRARTISATRPLPVSAERPGEPPLPLSPRPRRPQDRRPRRRLRSEHDRGVPRNAPVPTRFDWATPGATVATSSLDQRMRQCASAGGARRGSGAGLYVMIARRGSRRGAGRRLPRRRSAGRTPRARARRRRARAAAGRSARDPPAAAGADRDACGRCSHDFARSLEVERAALEGLQRGRIGEGGHAPRAWRCSGTGRGTRPALRATLAPSSRW